MELYPEKSKISQININKISQDKRYNNFDDFRHQKIILKKHSNSTKQFNDKKKNLTNKFDLTDKYVYSVINKSFKRHKTSYKNFYIKKFSKQKLFKCENF